jgi:hypothetical protein
MVLDERFMREGRHFENWPREERRNSKVGVTQGEAGKCSG